MVQVKVIAGPGTGQIWEVKGPRTILGRYPDCDIPVLVPDASRHHAQLLLTAEGPFLEDLHSRNGTFLNDQLIRQREKLHDGDRIRIGEMVLQFIEVSGVQAAPKTEAREAMVPPVLTDQEIADFEQAIAPCRGREGTASF